jgi:nicotinamidase-related amidase
MQEGFRCKESTLIIPEIKKTIDNFPGEIIFSCFVDRAGSKFEKDLQWEKFQKKTNQQILAELRYPKAKKSKHTGYTILTASLLNFIRRKQFKTIYLAGVYTDACIIKAAMDAFDNNLPVKVISNCCTSLHSRNNHKCAIDSLRHIIGNNNVKSHIH